MNTFSKNYNFPVTDSTEVIYIFRTVTIVITLSKFLTVDIDT